MNDKKTNVKTTENNHGGIDWISMIVPLVGVVVLAILFIVYPESSEANTLAIKNFFGNDLGVYYILMGLFAFSATMFIAFSKFGKIKLGAPNEKPKYGAFAWGSMIFTATMAADILYYSLSEWAMYGGEPYVESMGEMQRWAPTFPLFHWGPIAWSFYIVLAAAFGFMLHVRQRNKQKFSEACRPILGKHVDGIAGRVIDTVAIFALIAGTATTFSIATPLLAGAFAHVFGISTGTTLTICILVLIATVYTIAVLTGMGGIAKLARFSVYLFFAFLFYFLFLGGETRYILETGVQSIGNLIQNFVGLATTTDPLRETGWEPGEGFAQAWTVFYWAYWMAWCVATPFFIGMISKGRTLKNTVLGAYSWGLAGTFTSFIILGNYGLSQQMKHGIDSIGAILETEWTTPEISEIIINIFNTLPFPKVALVLLVVNMVIFYATTFDALTMVISCYSHKKLKPGEEPSKRVRAFWAVLLILLPIGLLFADQAIQSLMSVAIIAAFPIGIIILLIVFSFFKDARKYIGENKCKVIESSELSEP